MKNLWLRLIGSRLWSLFLKELYQLKRNKRLVVLLILPPTMNLVLFGYALNPEVTNLRLGVFDESHTAESRELISTFTESRAFAIRGNYSDVTLLGKDLSSGALDAGLIIPADFARARARKVTASTQLLINAVDSNMATIASGYAGLIVKSYNERLAKSGNGSGPLQIVTAPTIIADNEQINISNSVQNFNNAPPARPANFSVRVALLYNPGLRNSWFIVTGMIGTLLILQGSLISAASLVREKEMGTVEQLLMTPAEPWEIIVAKIAPIFFLLMFDILLAIMVGRIVFEVPLRGNFFLLFFAGALCLLCGIGIGTFIATFARSQQQAQLIAFFVNPPIALLSGATTPVEAMPKFLQYFTYLNPVRHFGIISRGVMLKGVGTDILYPHILALLIFALILMGVSARQFRKHLG